MNPIYYIIIAGLAAIIILLVIMIKKIQTKPKDGEQNLFLMLQNQINELNKSMDQKMSDTHKLMSDNQDNINKTIQGQFGQSIKIITDVTEKLTKLDETNKQVMGFTNQLQILQETLQNPKHRGILGEYYLETVLKNVLPPGSYEMQYKFSDGDIVDAVVKVKDKIIPIDSKFSLENYNRLIQEKDQTRKEELEAAFKSDLKKRIDETSKYIKPKEGTMDFAFMFLPAEGIYYDLLINKVGAIKTNTHDLIEYAFKQKHVIIVSPTSFLAYLQTVMQGLRALKIEESAKEIRQRVEELGKHISAYDEYFKKLGKNIETTAKSYNVAYKELNKIDKDVVRITDGDKKIEPMLIDGPNLEE
ncbi:MAG: DNA recombination protein RmuC [Candidatus Magasanikbacteria bacterium CG10_big_fil_rev_8_21_14_0_10_36_32]|uniref:DNA recombination protein RmuC n=1 Tax=Candidatus Magasanikbacteria bacterium CG10_big_fil_rev_8_21_14_0_10_36_32 TaxID=1974646 RepID=A0A2M6W6Y9_9BACT|nr:MAG: DNA recombination protein RmuC [Candidatus Magasanikbacteria bacterium CG10_big_fil_rev_8_21_14_0_10_36_32]